MKKQLSEGKDIMSILPVLSAYMGHRNMSGTERYLHLVQEIFPEIRNKLDNQIVPDIGGEIDHEESSLSIG